jgi:hypothetical protein
MPPNKYNETGKQSTAVLQTTTMDSTAVPPLDNSKSITTKPEETTKESVARIEARCTAQVVKELELQFQVEYPPTRDYDTNYVKSRPGKHIYKEERAYWKVSDHFNLGIKLTEEATQHTWLSCWHWVLDKMMDALDVVASDLGSEPFLTTTGTHRRQLLSKICCSVSQLKGKCLDPQGQLRGVHHKDKNASWELIKDCCGGPMRWW